VQSGGEGAERLVVYVVVETEIDAPQLAKELNALVSQQINPLFKIHELIFVDALPRTASNKLMRRSLRERYLQGSS
jgi:acetyl-CoA synthetase